jgi:hypothetical protein
VITGTPAFHDGPSGIHRLPPLAQRLATDFTTDARFDNPRAVQLRLPGFDRTSLMSLGITVRDLYAGGSADPERIERTVDAAYVTQLAEAVAGSLGGKVFTPFRTEKRRNPVTGAVYPWIGAPWRPSRRPANPGHRTRTPSATSAINSSRSSPTATRSTASAVAGESFPACSITVRVTVGPRRTGGRGRG